MGRSKRNQNIAPGHSQTPLKTDDRCHTRVLHTLLQMPTDAVDSGSTWDCESGFCGNSEAQSKNRSEPAYAANTYVPRTAADCTIILTVVEVHKYQPAA